MNGLILFGAGAIAETFFDYLTFDSNRPVRAFCVDGQFLKESTFKGLPVLALEEIVRHFSPEDHQFLTAVGFQNRNALRRDKYKTPKALGYTGATYVHSQVRPWPTVTLGEDVMIMEQNVIQPHVHIGHNVTIWSGNHIGHHSQIGNHCFIASHAVISGHVQVEAQSFIGVNATLKDNIRIGSQCVVGAGTLVLQDLPDHTVVKGLESPLITREKAA